MTDRELLERAAKAAGIFFTWLNGDGAREDRKPGIMQPYVRWNPLADDGDALRLVVGLSLDIITRASDRETWVQAPMTPTVIEPWASDPYAATRRAIVRAAAALAQEVSMMNAKEMAERLRWLSHNSGWGDDATAKDAADLIEQQAAEIAAFRRAALDYVQDVDRLNADVDRLNAEIAALRADADALAAQVLHLKGGTNGANS